MIFCFFSTSFSPSLSPFPFPLPFSFSFLFPFPFPFSFPFHSSSPSPFPFPFPSLVQYQVKAWNATYCYFILLYKKGPCMHYTKISAKHMHLSNAWSQNNHSLFVTHIDIRSLRENACNLCSDLKSKNSKKKILLRAPPWINFIYLFIWPFLVIKQLHWAFLFVRSCFLNSGNEVIIKWLWECWLYFVNVAIYDI